MGRDSGAPPWQHHTDRRVNDTSRRDHNERVALPGPIRRREEGGPRGQAVGTVHGADTDHQGDEETR